MAFNLLWAADGRSQVILDRRDASPSGRLNRLELRYEAGGFLHRSKLAARRAARDRDRFQSEETAILPAVA